MEKILKLYKYVDGVNDTPFPSEEEQAILYSFDFNAQRMGGARTASAKLKHRLCLDDLWSEEVYAEFNGERFFIRSIPSSSKDNTDGRYEHELDLYSETEILNHVYFIDAVQGDSGIDVYKSNSTKIIFTGDVNQFAERLNASLSYSGLDFNVVVDEGITSEDKMVSFEDKYIMSALQEIFNIYELPYYFVGRTIHIGYTQNTITYPLKYGHDEALLSIAKNNANYQVINRITGIGSTDNIPYYYPNESDNREEVEASGKKWITPMPNLMPSIYRESEGAEMFYNAINNTYPTPEGGYYEFENLYEPNKAKEGKVTFENIKPSIVGMTNASSQRIDMFIEFAYDQNDNDEVDSEGNYVHPYFFAKMRKTDGEYGFNLFDQAIESQAMQISFTSGVCGACTFDIGVGEETQKNIVQVDDSGNLKRDESGNVLWKNQVPQDRQNDTSKYEVWIALKKEDSTYGQIMPNVSQNLKPSTSDTFVILGIDMPLAYVKAAEKKLDESLIKYMWMNNRDKFTFSIKFSRIFFTEHPEILEQLNENSRVIVEYNNQQHTLYVDSYSYHMDADSPLPEIEVDLVDTLTIGQNSLQTALDSIKQDILSSIGGGDILKQGLKYFLRKDVNDTANGKITFRKGAEFGRYTTGLLGTGGAVFIDKDGNSHAEFDYLNIRKKAMFTEITVQELKHIGGALIISPAAMIISKVEETENGYKCFFETEDEDGKKIYNEFEVGDQARCQTFNVEKQSNGQLGNRYWWRLVTEVGDDYVVFSKDDADTGSDAPQAGDEVAQLGNRTDKTRQNAQVYSAYGSDSPSRKMYQGIDSYSLVDKVIKDEYFDVTTNRFKEVTYGDFYVGDKEQTTYVQYDQDNGVKVKGAVSIEQGSSGWENIDGLSGIIKDVSDTASSAQDAADKAQEDASNAKQDAQEANDKLTEWSKDSVISPTEKIALKQELANLDSEYKTNIANANKYGIDTSSYTSSWNTYKAELEYHSADTPENITIRDTFKTSQSAFYVSREELLTAIAQAAKEYADKLVDSIGVGAENLLLNTGFTGNYETSPLNPSTPLRSNSNLYSKPLDKWSGDGEVVADTNSTSGYACIIGSLSQNVVLIANENYVISYKAKGNSVTVECGGSVFTDTLNSSYVVYKHKFVHKSGGVFKISGSATVCEIKLERGTIATDWCPSRLDKNSVADEFKNYWYLKDALQGHTKILGGLTLTTMIQLGQWVDGVMKKVNAGISGIYNDDQDVAFWGGGTFEEAINTVNKVIKGELPTESEWKNLANFVVTHGGDIIIRGYVYAMGGYFRGVIDLGNGAVHLNEDGTGWLGINDKGEKIILINEDSVDINAKLHAGAGSTIGNLTVSESGSLYGFSSTISRASSGVRIEPFSRGEVNNFIKDNIAKSSTFFLIFNGFTEGGPYDVYLPNADFLLQNKPEALEGVLAITIIVPLYYAPFSSIPNEATFELKANSPSVIYGSDGTVKSSITMSKGNTLEIMAVISQRDASIGVVVDYYIKSLNQ